MRTSTVTSCSITAPVLTRANSPDATSVEPGWSYRATYLVAQG